MQCNLAVSSAAEQDKLLKFICV